MRIRLKFEPCDLWVGAYFSYADGRFDTVHRLYICLVPMLPIVITWWKRGCEP